MSDEVYHADDGDISRYLMQTPPPESHVFPAPAAGGEPVATHLWAPPQQVPPVAQGGVALPTGPTPLNLSNAAFGYDVEDHHAIAMAMAMDVDVQPPPQGQYGFFPADPVPARLDDDRLPGFEATLEHSALQELLGTLSLNDDDDDDDDHSMDDDGDDDDDDDDSLLEALLESLEEDAGGNTDSSALAQHSESSAAVEEGRLTFVPFFPGHLDCSKCLTVREVLHESVTQRVYFVVHISELGTFQHAISDLAYIDATNGQTILNELKFVDLRRRTYECVQKFIADSVEMLKNDTSGQLRDSAFPTSQENNGMHKHIQLEMDMLKEILSTPSSNTEAVGVPHSGPEAPHQTVTRAENTNADHTGLNSANVPVFSPAILESSQQVSVVQDGMPPSSNDASAIGSYETQRAKQRRRISQMTMKDVVNLIHMSKKDAAKKLNISVTALKRLCRRNNTDRWPARKIKALDKKIKKHEQAALRNVGTRGLLAIMENMEELKYERAQVYADVLKVIRENQNHNDGAGSSSG